MLMKCCLGRRQPAVICFNIIDIDLQVQTVAQMIRKSPKIG